jgi:hypothetical protein
MGKAFFLRREKKLYTEGSNLYLTTPDNLKIAKDQNLTNCNVFLQFMNRRIPYQLECKIIGRFRMLPEIVETLDFNAKAAYKLLPISTLKKQDKRQFYRYTLKNYGDSRSPVLPILVSRRLFAIPTRNSPKKAHHLCCSKMLN